MHIGRRVFILTKARTCIHPRVPGIPLFSTSVSTPTLKSSHNHDTWGFALQADAVISSVERHETHCAHLTTTAVT
jgi:hypothetical protein